MLGVHVQQPSVLLESRSLFRALSGLCWDSTMGNTAEKMGNFGLDIFSTVITMTKFPPLYIKHFAFLKNKTNKTKNKNLEKSSEKK